MELLIIQALVFVAYVSFVIYEYGVLPSISDSWYSLPNSDKWFFTLFTWGIGIPMLLYGSPLLFLSGTGLCFVGAATQFKLTSSYTKYVHFAGAGIGIILPVCYIATLGLWQPLFILSLLTALILVVDKDIINNKLWWIEISSFLCIIGGMLAATLKM